MHVLISKLFSAGFCCLSFMVLVFLVQFIYILGIHFLGKVLVTLASSQDLFTSARHSSGAIKLISSSTQMTCIWGGLQPCTNTGGLLLAHSYPSNAVLRGWLSPPRMDSALSSACCVPKDSENQNLNSLSGSFT